MAREDLHFRLRIPELLKERVESAANANRRSMTAEIVKRLENSFDTIALELDLDNGGIKETRSESWRRRQYYKAMNEAAAIEQITEITRELSDAVAALNEIREANEYEARRPRREHE